MLVRAQIAMVYDDEEPLLFGKLLNTAGRGFASLPHKATAVFAHKQSIISRSNPETLPIHHFAKGGKKVVRLFKSDGFKLFVSHIVYFGCFSCCGRGGGRIE
jgi:hypothetical protein